MFLPCVRKTSNIHKWFKLSDQRYYHVPCCGAMQVLKWSQVKWDKNDMGKRCLKRLATNVVSAAMLSVDQGSQMLTGWLKGSGSRSTPK
ncbi:phage terminase large subunit family protein [Salmonella enterica]|uniref:phage terminase large subunit family protein n=1 Tax=Salmonella enterica TaxID=28901 RepID=UPI0023DD224C|nr:phage terminase large subunit family protein [Salmonella enterica]